MAYPESVIAYAFVEKGIEEGQFVTQLKLQKMAYFAHGYHLAKYGEPLVMERFEAWKFNPVVVDIYQTYKLYGGDPIMDTFFLPKAPRAYRYKPLGETALDAIEYSWKVTKHLSGARLSPWWHLDGSPWAKAFNFLNPSAAIQNDSIQSYFQNLLSENPA